MRTMATRITVPLLCAAAAIPMLFGGIPGGKIRKQTPLPERTTAAQAPWNGSHTANTPWADKCGCRLVRETVGDEAPGDTPPVATEPAASQAAACRDIKPEDRELLMRIAMAEVGGDNCTECMALVMLTVLNRVEYNGFSSTVRGVIYSKDQFTPVADGRFETVSPNERCHEALELVLSGWDESQGCLFFESCTGPSWHSKNLLLLFEHCHTRFYTYPPRAT